MRKSELEKKAGDLLKFGLTEYQAKVFVGALALSKAKATELTGLVDIPKARVYQILSELIEMGAVRKRPGRPAIYVALEPDTALTNILEYRREKNEKELGIMEETKDSLLPGLNALFEAGKPESAGTFLEVIPSGEVSTIETRRLYNSAEKEIRILSGVFEYLPRVLHDLEEASERGVKIRVMLLDPEVLDKRGRKIQSEVIEFLGGIRAKIRYAKSMPLRAGISDKVAVFSADEKKNLQLKKEVAITMDESMISALSQYFDLMWEKAKP